MSTAKPTIGVTQELEQNFPLMIHPANVVRSELGANLVPDAYGAISWCPVFAERSTDEFGTRQLSPPCGRTRVMCAPLRLVVALGFSA